ncbi:hypothetical protein ACHAWF_013871 [Thalassiosira exigua]
MRGREPGPCASNRVPKGAQPSTMVAARASCSRAFNLLLFVTSAQINNSLAFLGPSKYRICSTDSNIRRPLRRTVNSAGNEPNSDHFEGETEEAESGFAALPPIGSSSFWDQNENVSSSYHDTPASAFVWPSGNAKNKIITSDQTSLVSPKFQIQYTCKICSTRNSHSVTRMAYRKGVVIAMCKGCESKHLIADNLGWSNYIGGFDFDNGETNIEMYMENNAAGGSDEKDLVMRVDQNVFDLEKVLYKHQEEDILSSKSANEDDKIDNGESWI